MRLRAVRREGNGHTKVLLCSLRCLLPLLDGGSKTLPNLLVHLSPHVGRLLTPSVLNARHTLSATSATFSVIVRADGDVWNWRELLATAERAVAENAARSMDIVSFVAAAEMLYQTDRRRR